MKKNVSKIGLFSMFLIVMVSCKDVENELANKRISALEIYVDSLKEVSTENRQANWDKIAADFDKKALEAKVAIGSLKEDEKTNFQTKVDAATEKYADFKLNVQSKHEKSIVVTKPKPNQNLRDRLFGAGKIGEDMNFFWVNKNNILKTYDIFFQAYKVNKATFSCEDYDELKVMYDALDTRKNTFW